MLHILVFSALFLASFISTIMDRENIIDKLELQNTFAQPQRERGFAKFPNIGTFLQTFLKPDLLYSL